MLDETLRPPRQGDDDEGRVLVVDPPDPHRWSAFLALGAAVFGRPAWWPETAPDDGQRAGWERLSAGRRIAPARPARRPGGFADAGLTMLRTSDDGLPEIWCRCDGGPHGFLSIAAHAHADALSLEVRVGGVDVLADPGTYCYHGEPRVAGLLPVHPRPQHRCRSAGGTSPSPAARSCGSGRRTAGSSR